MTEVKSVVFKNFTDKEFVCSWDSVPYRFPAGKEMYVEDWKATHFAKHLVDRVMHERGQITSNVKEREPLLALALPSEPELSHEEALDLNAREEVKEKEEEIKGGRKARKSAKTESEEEFPELKKSLKANKK